MLEQMNIGRGEALPDVDGTFRNYLMNTLCNDGLEETVKNTGGLQIETQIVYPAGAFWVFITIDIHERHPDMSIWYSCVDEQQSPKSTLSFWPTADSNSEHLVVDWIDDVIREIHEYARFMGFE